jgi:hypothetical protein
LAFRIANVLKARFICKYLVQKPGDNEHLDTYTAHLNAEKTILASLLVNMPSLPVNRAIQED